MFSYGHLRFRYIDSCFVFWVFVSYSLLHNCLRYRDKKTSFLAQVRCNFIKLHGNIICNKCCLGQCCSVWKRGRLSFWIRQCLLLISEMWSPPPIPEVRMQLLIVSHKTRVNWNKKMMCMCVYDTEKTF